MEDDEATTDDDVVALGNRVYFYAPVTRMSVLKLIKALKEATASCLQTHDHKDATVRLYIHSNGGDAFAGLAAMDHIQLNPVPVVAIADGMVASAASFMLLAAKRRLALPHAYVRIHQLSLNGFDGKYAELVDEMQNTHAMMLKIKTLYQERTKMRAKRIEDILKQELDMDADECVREGVVHEIMRAH